MKDEELKKLKQELKAKKKELKQKKKEQKKKKPEKTRPQKPSKAAKLGFYILRYGALILIHILPIFLAIYFLLNYKLLEDLIIQSILLIFTRDFTKVINLTLRLFIPLAFYLIFGLFFWALMIWPAIKRKFPIMILEVDGVQEKGGRIWYISPNRFTQKLEKLAKRAGIEYKQAGYWLFRTRKLINPFKPLKSVNKLYIQESAKPYIIKKNKKIILKDLYFLQYKDGYMLIKQKFKSAEIDIQELNGVISTDAKRISQTVSSYVLANARIMLSNVGSSTFWVSPELLEIKEHLNLGSENVGWERLSELIEKYESNREVVLEDGKVTPEEASTKILPVFNEILKIANSMKAKFNISDIPDPPRTYNNLITLQQIDSYINQLKTALEGYKDIRGFKE